MLLSLRASAQYLERPEYEPLSARYLYAGVSSMEMMPRTSNSAPDSLAIRFSAWMPFVGLKQGLVDLYFGYTRFTQNGATHPAIVLGTSVAMEVLLTGRTQSALLLPVLLSADYTRADAGGAERDNFNVGSVGLGAGVRYRGGGDRVDFSIGVVGCAHFSFEGLNAATGSSLAAIGEASVRWSGVPVGGGIVLGYRARVQTWTMSNDHLNYQLVTHGPFLGVMF
jgi:hypothetical protein